MIQSLKTITKVNKEKQKLTTAKKIKFAAGFIIGIGADMTAAAIIGRHLPNITGWRKVMLRIGAFVISMKVGEDCEKYFYAIYDETAEAIKDAKEELKASETEEAEGAVE